MSTPSRSSRLRARACSRNERGSVSLQLAVLFPAVLLLIFGVIQGALYYYARSVALAAAQEGLRDARVENGTAGAGARRARGFLARADDGMLTTVSVSPSRTAVSASVTVTGRSLSLVPGMPGLRVAQTAAGPVERLTGSGRP